MSAIPSFPYSDLWGEKQIESVANLTREDSQLFFEKLDAIEVHPTLRLYELKDANQALDDLKAGHFQGAALIKIA